MCNACFRRMVLTLIQECYGDLHTNLLRAFDPQTMKNGESLMDRGQLREAQAAFITVMDEMPFPVIFMHQYDIALLFLFRGFMFHGLSLVFFPL